MSLDDRLSSPKDDRKFGKVIVGSGTFISGSGFGFGSGSCEGDYKDLRVSDERVGSQRISGDIGVYEFSAESSTFRNMDSVNWDSIKNVSFYGCLIGGIGFVGSMIVIGYGVYRMIGG
jgi:hypothetical protein|tara:strand:- start:130 stop:483 length:354 start_codon:yes stop_codon:yes gene_type:complete